MDDSDDDDNFVTIGTPLAAYEEDEPLKKPVTVQDQTVKDSRGRQRFHGAFTGGFSAGYFNTVGSKDGFTPSTFVSSRQTRTDQSGQRPEDFMDDEDLGEYGIAPRQIQPTEDFTSARRQNLKRPHVSDGIIPGETPLAHLIIPARLPMGIRLLRKLGWREGQGVGQKVKRKKKRKPQQAATDGKKTYGCSLPTPGGESGSSTDDSDLCPKDVTFAPKDVTPISFTPKADVHGLGYSGITVPGMGYSGVTVPGVIRQTQRPPGPRHRGSKGITGQAFGVGAMEDDDADIYSTSNMSEYDMTLDGPDDNVTHGWTAPKHHTGKQAPKDYAESVLEGFKLLSTLAPKQVFAPPKLPKGFKAYHVFNEEEQNSLKAAAAIPQKFSLSWKKMDASTRREALGEKPVFKSVFDLVPDKDKQNIEVVKSVHQEAAQMQDDLKNKMDKKTADKRKELTTAVTTNLANKFQSAGVEKTDSSGSIGTVSGSTGTAQQQKPTNTPLFKGSVGFKPFAREPKKQERYEQYVECRKKGQTYEFDDSHCTEMTEWDKGREREEFARSQALYRPMASMMATRFTRAQYEDDDKVEMNKDQAKDVSDQAKAADIKMYGKLTRDTMEWHPDKVLCKRFNIPNPYPDSGIVGLPRVKRDKYSVFNFLSFPDQPAPEDNDKQQETEVVEPTSVKDSKRKLGQQGKPLAILASIDLRRPAKKQQDEKNTNEDYTVEQPDTETGEPGSDRPPIDLFKAIFEDSDSEDSDVPLTPDTEPEDISVTHSTQDASGHSQNTSGLGVLQSSLSATVLATVPHENPFSGLFSSKIITDPKNTAENLSHSPHLGTENGRTFISEYENQTDPILVNVEDIQKVQDRLHGTSPKDDQEETVMETNVDYYGPALPPTTSLPAVNAEQSQPKTKKKEKDRHKHKKKKSKHKKHKNKTKHKKERKKKKKVKSLTPPSSPSNSSVSSDQEGSSDEVPNDAQIMGKLRTITGRLSAADFM